MQIRSDRRRRAAHPDPEAERMVREGAKVVRDGQIRVARGLARVHRRKTHLLHGCSSAVDYAMRFGFSRREASDLLRMGVALENDQDGKGERGLRDGRVSADHAAALGKLFAAAEKEQRERGTPETTGASDGAQPVPPPLVRPPLVRPDEDWFEDAGALTPGALRKRIHERIEGHGAPEPVRSVAIAARESVVDDFRRAHTIASRRAGTILSDGETLATLTDEYLTRHDPLRTKRLVRRVGPTSERPWDRYVPAAVVAALLERSGDRCEFPGCNNRVFLQNAHIVDHDDDGDREVCNLCRLCTDHHALFDAGRIRFLEWERDAEGVERPVFVDAVTGEVFTSREKRARRRRAAPAVERGAGGDEAVHGDGGADEQPGTQDVSRRAGFLWGSEVRERAPAYARAASERDVVSGSGADPPAVTESGAHACAWPGSYTRGLILAR